MRPHSRLRYASERAGLWADDRLHRDPCARLLRLPPGRDPYPVYEAVRARGDLVHSRRGLAVTASYSTASSVLRSAEFGAVPTTRRPARPADDDPVHPLDDAFLSLDPPRHTRLRSLVAPYFTPARTRLMTAHIEETVADRLHDLHRHGGGPVDLVDAFAASIPASTICHLMGLPQADMPRITAWGQMLARVVDGPRTPAEARHTRRVIEEMTRYFRHRLVRPGPGGGGGLLEVLADRCPADLTARDAVATAGMLLLGGHATTVNLIGSAIAAVLAHPHVDVDSRDAADAVVAETLRWDPPVQYTVRAARQETAVNGVTLAAGTRVVVLLAGAGRDPAVFSRPAVFDPGRGNARQHLGFGAGIHYCLGATLARLEAGAAIAQLYDTYAVRLAGPAERSPSRCLRGLARLPVYLTIRSRART